jgi:hypothetical protein
MIGHNNPPHAIALEEAREFEVECTRLGAVENEQEAKHAAFLIDREVKGRKAAEVARTSEKKPHLDAAKEVDDCWKPVTEIYQSAIVHVKAAVLDWQRRERARIAQEQEAARLEAERAQEAAMRALEASKPNDIWAEIEAKQAVAEADAAAEKVAVLEASAVPMQVKAEGIRARGIKLAWSADILDPVAMTKALADHPAVQEAAAKVAHSMARSMKDAFKLDGCKAKSVETL